MKSFPVIGNGIFIYQMFTWPMTPRDPQKCREAVRSAILVTAWLFVYYAMNGGLRLVVISGAPLLSVGVGWLYCTYCVMECVLLQYNFITLSCSKDHGVVFLLAWGALGVERRQRDGCFVTGYDIFRVVKMLRVSVFNGELLVYIFTYLLTYLHCVQKKTPTHIFFHESCVDLNKNCSEYT